MNLGGGVQSQSRARSLHIYTATGRRHATTERTHAVASGTHPLIHIQPDQAFLLPPLYAAGWECLSSSPDFSSHANPAPSPSPPSDPPREFRWDPGHATGPLPRPWGSEISNPPRRLNA
jgi:hypothetical protein